MAIKNKTGIIYFIRMNLICLEFYADSKKLADVYFNTIFTENWVALKGTINIAKYFRCIVPQYLYYHIIQNIKRNWTWTYILNTILYTTVW